MKSLFFAIRMTRRYVRPLAITVVSMFALVAVQLITPQLVRHMINRVTAPVAQVTAAGAAAPAERMGAPAAKVATATATAPAQGTTAPVAQAAQAEAATPAERPTATADATAAGTMRYVTMLALLALAIFAIRGVLSFLRSYMSHVAGWNVVADVRSDVYKHLQRLSLRFYEDKQTGQLMSRMVNDSELLEQLIAHAIPDTLVNVLMLVGVVVAMGRMSWELTLVSMIPIPLIIVATHMISKHVRPAFRARQVELGQLNAALNDNLSGIREIKAFTMEEAQAAEMGGHIDRYRNSLLRALRLMATFSPFVDFSASLGTVTFIYFGGWLVLSHALKVGDLFAIYLYLEMLYQPVRALSGVWENVQTALAGAERVSELLQEEPDMVDKHDAKEFAGRARGAIALRHVQFAYTPGETVLDDIDLDIAPGTVVALVGPTGVGKTTLASLIPRFYDVSGGSILLDGHDVRDLKLKSLRQQISLVLQDVFLFNGSIRGNILFGRPDATEEEMLEASRTANAHEFIARMPEGYDTLIGERGIKLSGGQRQRLAIARAVLKNAPILILDEATSSVDAETELLIQQALERLMVGKTTIIIAHRLSTIRSADTIVVLEGNRIAEKGNHEQLMQSGGLYARLNSFQREGEPRWRLVREQRQSALVGAQETAENPAAAS